MANVYRGIERGIYSDTYNFLLKYIQLDKLTERDWQSIVEEAANVCTKYKQHPMCVQMIGLCVQQLENKFGNKKLGAKTYNEWEHDITNV